MAKDFVPFNELPGFDELDEEEREIQARRIKTYSKEALKAGQKVDALYVLHPQFKSALESCDRIFQIARELRVPHGMRLIGPPGTGKSSVFRYFKDSLPSSTLFAPGWGAIGIRAYQRATVGHLVAALLRAYKYPFSQISEKTVYLRRGLVFELVRQKGTRLIFIDSAQYLLLHGKTNGIEPTANDFIAELMDETGVGIVLAGSELLGKDECFDAELRSRIVERNETQNFLPNQHWEGFLKSLVKSCSWFNISLLLSSGQPKAIHGASDGNPRAFKRLLTEAVMVGAQEGGTVLEAHHLELAFTRVYGNAALRLNPYVQQSAVASESGPVR